MIQNDCIMAVMVATPAVDESDADVWIQPSMFKSTVLLRQTEVDGVDRPQDPLVIKLLELAKEYGMNVLYARQGFDYPRT